MRTQEVGRWGEEVATAHLVAQGYAIVERNWKLGHYEIDIIAQKDEYIIFAEVKTRENDNTDPVDAVNTRKRNHMIASANAYLHKFNIPFEYRFDIIAITGVPGNFKLEHIPDAFVPQLKRYNYSFRL